MKQKFPTSKSNGSQHKSPSAEGAAAIHVGVSLRRLRGQMGLRIEDVARRAGFTKGFLSKIENGKSSPPIATLMRLAGALGVDPAALLQSDDGAKSGNANSAVHVPAAARQRVQNAGAGPGYTYWALAAGRAHKAMEPFLLTVHPKEFDPKKTFQHPGEEFIFVLEGRCTYRVGDDIFDLRAGDSLYFDARKPHAPHPKGGPVTFLAMFCAPPRLVRSSRAKKGVR